MYLFNSGSQIISPMYGDRQNTSSKVRHWQWIFGVLILLLAAALLMNGIWKMYMRGDEDLTFENTDPSLEITLHQLAYENNHPPLWYTNFWFWRRLVGDSEFAGRMESILFSMMTLALVYQMGRTWFKSPRAGLFAMLVLAVNAFFLVFSLEMRPYGMVMLGAASSMWLFYRWLTRQTWRSAIVYGLSLALLMYLHYYLFFLILSQILFFLFFQRPRWQLFKQGLTAGIIAFVVWLPWLPMLFYQLAFLSDPNTPKQAIKPGLASTTYPTNQRTINELLQIATNGQVIFVLAILVIGSIWLWRKAGYRLALVWTVSVPAILLFINQYSGLYTHRYVVFLVLGLALAVGAALAEFPRLLRFIALIALVALSLLALPSFFPNRAPIRDYFLTMSELAKPGDVVFFDGRSANATQIERYLSTDLQANQAHSLDEAAQSRRIWFVTDTWFDEATRAGFDALTQTHPLQLVLGDCNSSWCYLAQLLEGTPRRTSLVFGGEMPFWGQDIVEITPESLTVRLWWRAEQVPDADYSIGLYLADSTGVVITQTDGPIQSIYGDVIPVQNMQPDIIYIDQRVLSLPAELPPGEYQLLLVVYQWWDNTRLELPDGTDSLLLDTITLG